MPLKIIIVGAGIAGLCAGIALRQAGHEVEVCFLLTSHKLHYALLCKRFFF
jgi:monoamine oxidase